MKLKKYLGCIVSKGGSQTRIVQVQFTIGFLYKVATKLYVKSSLTSMTGSLIGSEFFSVNDRKTENTPSAAQEELKT